MAGGTDGAVVEAVGTVGVVDAGQVVARLGEVLDPELDQSLPDLGFIEAVEIRGAEVCVRFRLPTFWCAANFAFLMAADIAAAVRRVPGVANVRVLLVDHYAEDEITEAVNAGRSFSEAFAGEADGDLEELRHTFLVKGFLIRQEQLVRYLMRAGCASERLASLRQADLRAEQGDVFVRAPGDAPAEADWRTVAGAARVYALWHRRRASLGLALDPDAPLLTSADGAPVTADEVPALLRAARSIRLNGAFNTLLCTGLNHTRHGVRTDDIEALPDALCIPKGDAIQ